MTFFVRIYSQSDEMVDIECGEIKRELRPGSNVEIIAENDDDAILVRRRVLAQGLPPEGPGDPEIEPPEDTKEEAAFDPNQKPAVPEPVPEPEAEPEAPAAFDPNQKPAEVKPEDMPPPAEEAATAEGMPPAAETPPPLADEPENPPVADDPPVKTTTTTRRR